MSNKCPESIAFWGFEGQSNHMLLTFTTDSPKQLALPSFKLRLHQ